MLPRSIILLSLAAAFAASTGLAEINGNWPHWRGSRDNASNEDGSYPVQYKVLSENKMGEPVIASPVPVANRLLIRGEKHLFCIAAPK